MIEAGYLDEAEEIYWQDLRKAPQNGYSLRGLLNVAEKKADPRFEEYKSKFDESWRRADINLNSSRF